jgi:hypothetical protein
MRSCWLASRGSGSENASTYGTRNNNLNEMGLGARFESVVPVWMGVVSMDGECFHLGL